MIIRFRIRYVYAKTGRSCSQEYFANSISELNSKIDEFNEGCDFGFYSGYKVLYVKEDNR